jgi:hypothetical protein
VVPVSCGAAFDNCRVGLSISSKPMAVPSRVASRIVSGLKRFQPILAQAKARDVNESDTVVIVADILQEVFGYDKYTEITSEHAIRGTYVDLAIKLDGTLTLLVEVKAVGLDLKDGYVKQAVDYAANQGVDWVVLTTGVLWRVYKITFAKPIDFEQVVEFNFLELNPKNEDQIELVYLLTKESWQKAMLGEYHAQKQALNRFVLAALLLSDPILDVVRRELRRISPGVRIETPEIQNALALEVLKREVTEGEKAEAARKIVQKASNRTLRAVKATADDGSEQATSATSTLATEQVDVVEAPLPKSDEGLS